jgi:hypothetical protein
LPSPRGPHLLWGPPSLLFIGRHEIKRSECEDGYSPPSSAAANNGVVHYPLCLLGVTLNLLSIGTALHANSKVNNLKIYKDIKKYIIKSINK